MSLVLQSSGGGSVTLQEAVTASNLTITVPATDGTMALTSQLPVAGPAFSAFRSSSQSMTSGVNTKVAFNSELYDTANCYDNTTNYRFTPNVAGYYQINIKVQTDGSPPSDIFCSISKNGGTEVYRGNRGTSGVISSNVSTIVYLNGSTDYVEGYFYQTATGIAGGAMSGGDQSWFNGSLVRSA
jgi:hypothetical protein